MTLEVRKEFEEARAILSGHFRLTSGLHSDTYLQCARVLEDPRRAERLAAVLAGPWKSERITAVLAPAVGGIVIGYELARQLGARSIYCERENGKMTLRRGFSIGMEDRLLLVEDVITTGGSIQEIRAVARERGASVAGGCALVDRGGSKGVEGTFRSLLSLAPPIWTPEQCPLCKRGLPMDTPGSRHLSAPKA